MGRQRNILVIDDNNIICETLLLYLESKGYNAKTATNGEDGLSLIQEERFEVVVLDILMPKMNGLDLMRRIKNSPGIKPKIIVSTGAGSQDIEIEARRLGAFDIIHKPILDLEKQLFPLIQKALELYDLSAQLIEKSRRVETLERHVNELFQFNRKLLRTSDDTRLLATIQEAVQTFSPGLHAALFRKTSSGFSRLGPQKHVIEIPESSLHAMCSTGLDLGLPPKTILQPISGAGTILGVFCIGGLRHQFSTECLSILALLPAVTCVFLTQEHTGIVS